MMESQPSSQTPPQAGRGAVILVLGILSIIMFGPLTGVPSWVMGHGDLKKIKAGIIVAGEEGLTRAGMILGIIGTAIYGLIILVIIVGIVIAVGLSMMKANTVAEERSGIVAEIHTIAKDMAEYRLHNGTYDGYDLPDHLRTTRRAYFMISVESPDEVKIVGKSRKDYGTVIATLKGDGTLNNWTYTGRFGEDKEEKSGEQTRQRVSFTF